MAKVNKTLIFILIIFPQLNLTATVGEEVGIPIGNPSYVTLKSDMAPKANESSYPFSVTKKVNIKDISIQKCSDLPLNFHSCTLSLCYDEAPFGKIYRKIIGEEKGGCKYIERVQDLGGMDCLFPNENLGKIRYLLNKHYSSLYDKSASFTDDEIKGLKEVYKSYCEVLPDSSFTKVITIDSKIYGKGELTEIIELEASHINNIKNRGTSPTPKNSESNESKAADGQFHSIMFKQDDIQAILSAIASLLNVDGLENELSSLTSTEEKKKEILSFYLNSIIYVSSENWAVWLNNYKVEDKQSQSVSVVKVTDNSAEFKWITDNLDKVSPNWLTKVTKVGNVYQSKDGNIKIYYDSDKAVSVNFILRPNQTFIIDNLSIIEGRIK